MIQVQEFFRSTRFEKNTSKSIQDLCQSIREKYPKSAPNYYERMFPLLPVRPFYNIVLKDRFSSNWEVIVKVLQSCFKKVQTWFRIKHQVTIDINQCLFASYIDRIIGTFGSHVNLYFPDVPAYFRSLGDLMTDQVHMRNELFKQSDSYDLSLSNSERHLLLFNRQSYTVFDNQIAINMNTSLIQYYIYLIYSVHKNKKIKLE